MAERSLRTLLRLRELAVDAARRELAQALRVEAAAHARCAAIAQAIDRERGVAGQSDADAVGAWALVPFLARMRAARQEAEAQAAAAQGCSEATRHELGTARGASRAVEGLLDQRAAGRRLAAERRERAMLDEVGQRGRNVAPRIELGPGAPAAGGGSAGM